MILLLLLGIAFMLNCILFRRTRFARIIMLYYVGYFILVIIGIFYFKQFTNYRYLSEWDYKILRFLSRIKIDIYKMSIIHNIGICVLMVATEECIRLVCPMKLSVRLLLLIPVLLMFILNLPELRWHMYIYQHMKSRSEFFELLNEGIRGFLILTAAVFFVAPIVFYIRYIVNTKIFVKKRYGLAGLVSIILIDIITLLLFITGVFAPTMFYNMDLLSFPMRDIGVYYEEIWSIIIVFVVMVLNFILLICFTPFEKHGMASLKKRKKENDALSNDIFMILHSYKNRFLGIQKLAALADASVEKGDMADVKGFLENIEKDSMTAAVDISRVLRAVNPVVMDYHIFSIEGCINDALSKCDLSKIKVIRKYEGQENYILGNRANIVECFLNIVCNAVEAIEQKNISDGEIKIQVYTEYDMFCVIVTDNGCGIPKAIFKKVFHPFFTTKSKKIGNGLGLDFVRRVSRIHGGDAIIKSSEGMYTSVYTAFPRYKR